MELTVITFLEVYILRSAISVLFGLGFGVRVRVRARVSGDGGWAAPFHP